MNRDFERIPGVKAATIGKVGEELTFPFPEVLEVIRLCSASEIAVLGVELFLVKADGYYALGCSDYDLQEKQRWPVAQESSWPEYVRYNNNLAEEYVLRNPLGDEHAYVLTAASWKEIQQMKIVR
jgi:hypothetical protein